MLRYLFLLLLPICCLACLSDGPLEGPVTTEIDRGSKWTLRIGSTPEEVYAQLQALDIEKGIGLVAVVGRSPFSTPQELSGLDRYNALTLQTTTGSLERVYVQFAADTIYGVYTGGARLDSVAQWPVGVAANQAILPGDPIADLRAKLIDLYQAPAYAEYQLVLPDKPLALAYDPAMGDFPEWSFAFFEAPDPPYQDRYTVRLFFADDRLDLIRVTHQRFEIVN